MARAIVFDTETTGISSEEKKSQIIEAAWLNVDDNLNVLDTFYQQYKPSVEISLGAMATHHIIPEDLEDSPLSDTFSLPESLEYMIGHNIDFDWDMAGKPDVKRICTLALARKFLPELDSHTQVALIYHFSEDKNKAREMVKNAHNALIDVKNCLFVLNGILNHCKNNLKLNTKDGMEELWKLSEAARIPDVLTIGKHKGKSYEEVAKEDMGYLRWMVKQEDMNEYMRAAAQTQIDKNNKSFKPF